MDIRAKQCFKKERGFHMEKIEVGEIFTISDEDEQEQEVEVLAAINIEGTNMLQSVL